MNVGQLTSASKGPIFLQHEFILNESLNLFKSRIGM